MARVSTAFKNRWESIDLHSLKQPVVFVVDMINGFVKEGALHDNAIIQIVPVLQSLLEEESLPRIFIADHHTSDAREFLSYPQHCLAETKESEVIDELLPYVGELYHKNSTNTFFCSGFQSFLKDIDRFRDIVLTGCCTDICILQFALSLCAWCNEHGKTEHSIIVVLDAVDTYHIDDLHDAVKENEFSLRNMEANGIRIVQSVKRG